MRNARVLYFGPVPVTDESVMMVVVEIVQGRSTRQQDFFFLLLRLFVKKLGPRKLKLWGRMSERGSQN